MSLRRTVFAAAALATAPLGPGDAAATAPPGTATPETATLTITIRGVLDQPSELWMGVFTADQYKLKQSPVSQGVKAAAPQTVVTFEGLAPGRVAVKVLQDLNGNQKMDTTLIGIPEEPFGLSNDAKPRGGLPGFDRTGFDLKPGPNAIVITLQEM